MASPEEHGFVLVAFAAPAEQIAAFRVTGELPLLERVCIFAYGLPLLASGGRESLKIVVGTQPRRVESKGELAEA